MSYSNQLKPRVFPLLSILLILAGCSGAPPSVRPEIEMPATYKETLRAGPWKTAEPAESIPRGEWWKVFADPTLDGLETQATAANQDLKAGLARLAQARALQQGARSSLFPQIGIGAGPTRQRPSPASQGLPANAETSPSTLWRAQATVAYEADLFGRIGSEVDTASAVTAQREALFRSLQLAIQADVAQSY